MKKIILVSVLSALMVACGDTDSTKTGSAKDIVGQAVEATKEVVKESTEKVAQAGTTGSIDKKAAVAEAKMIAKAFGGALKSELKAALKSGGPVNGLSVCNKQAAPIAKQLAKEKNALISRVSLKNRNPLNVPNDWQKAVLEDFDMRAAKGEDVAKMGFAEVVEHEGKKQIRFMKALPVVDVCLKCHGANIAEDVTAKLAELYPEDKAVGYQKGQVRGAVVVIKDLN